MKKAFTAEHGEMKISLGELCGLSISVNSV
jgi:hypothetical protein